MLRPVFQIEVPSIGRIFRLVPRPHWQRRTRLSDKGSDCVRYLCPTFELPVAGAAALFCTANASPLHTNNCARQGWQRQRRENLHWCKLKNYVRTCILCIGTLARILGALQSLHKAGIATFSWISKHQKQPTLSPFVFLFSYALHTRVLHMCVEVFAACACKHLCFPLKLLLFFWQTCLCCSSTDLSFSLSQFPIRLLHATNSTIIKDSSMLCPLCVLCFQLSLDPPPSWIFAPTSSLKRLQRDYYVKDQAW